MAQTTQTMRCLNTLNSCSHPRAVRVPIKPTFSPSHLSVDLPRHRLDRFCTPAIAERLSGLVDTPGLADISKDAPNLDGVAESTSQVIRTHDIPVDESILFQGFGWDSCEKGGKWYEIMESRISDLQKAGGFTHVWLPPPSQSVAPQGYLPSQLYNLETPYGDEAALVSLTSALKKAGIKPMADIVINHRCADAKGPDGKWNDFRDDVDHPDRSDVRVDWGQWAITGNDPDFGGHGREDTGADYGPAPDIDHQNEQVRESLKEWMRWLKNSIGFEGWRFDFVKGYAGRFTAEYIRDTIGEEEFNVGEFWTDASWSDCGLEYNQDGSRQALCDWIDDAQGQCTLFDFPTKGILQEAIKNCEYWRLVDPNGKPPGLIGWWPSKAVTFLDNHDTGSTQQHWPFPADRVLAGYAYIMTHPGIPTVLGEHFFEWGLGPEIAELMQVRRANGINARSNVVVQCAEHDMYVARIDDKVVLKLGPRYDMGDLCPREDEGFKVVASGPDYCVWAKDH